MYSIATIFLSLTIFSNISFASDFTDEYLEARNEYRHNVRKSYDDCRSSVSTAKYWYRFTQCHEQERGENIGGGCAHIAGRLNGSLNELEINADHCEVLKPDLEKTGEIFEEYIIQMKIQKCET